MLLKAKKINFLKANTKTNTTHNTTIADPQSFVKSFRQNDIITLKPKPKIQPHSSNINSETQSDLDGLSSNFSRSRSFSFKVGTPVPMMNSSFKLDSAGVTCGGPIADYESLTTSYTGLVAAAASFNNNNDNSQTNTYVKPSSRSALRTALSSNRSSHHNLLMTQSSLNLPKLLRRQNSNLASTTSINTNNHNHHHQQQQHQDTLNESAAAKQRRVSFGQIELQQLDIPVMYKHSNVALERFKLNPNFYLPDGKLKRKFSLPKLSDTLEQVKNCGYLRRHSTGNTSNNNNTSGYECDYDISDVKNIFKDIIQQNVSEYDLSYRE